MPEAMPGAVVHQPCTDDAVRAAAAAVLEAMLLYTNPAGPNNLMDLAVVASRTDIPVRVDHYHYGLGLPSRGICWALSDDKVDKGVDYDDKVVLLLPPFIPHRLRPRWDGEATVLLVGDAFPEDAVDLLTALSANLAANGRS